MAEDKKYITLTVEGTDYKTTVNKMYLNRKKWEKPDPRKVISYIPGTILEMFVKEGQEVEEGEVMLLLEAMKMCNKITAPFAGKIAKIHVEIGQKVPKGYLILEVK